MKVKDAPAGAAAAVHHVHGRHLAHRLEEDAVELGQQLRHELGAFGRGRDGIAEEVPAAGEERAEGRGIRALHDQLERHVGGQAHARRVVAEAPRPWCAADRRATPAAPARRRPGSRGAPRDRKAPGRRRCTAHTPVQCSRCSSMGTSPVAGSISCPASMQWSAQALMQRPQPLQNSGKTNGLALSFATARAPSVLPSRHFKGRASAQGPMKGLNRRSRGARLCAGPPRFGESLAAEARATRAASGKGARHAPCVSDPGGQREHPQSTAVATPMGASLRRAHPRGHELRHPRAAEAHRAARIISFAGGLPAPEVFPTARIEEAARRVLEEHGERRAAVQHHRGLSAPARAAGASHGPLRHRGDPGQRPRHLGRPAGPRPHRQAPHQSRATSS